jgi:hypothetical protein
VPELSCVVIPYIDLKRWHLTSDEESVSRENNSLVTILEEVADAVLRVARCMECSPGDALADFERLVMGRRLGDGLALGSTDHGEAPELFQLMSSQPAIL